MSVTIKQYEQLEARIRKGDLSALLARWRFGRKLLEERGEKERLPKGRVEAIMRSTGNTGVTYEAYKMELSRRMRFAERYPTKAQAVAAFDEFGSWRAIVERDMQLRAIEIVSRTRDEMERIDAETEWAGMPEHVAAGTMPRVIVSFANEADREKFCKMIGATIRKKARTAWSIFWPDRPRRTEVGVTLLSFVNREAA